MTEMDQVEIDKKEQEQQQQFNLEQMKDRRLRDRVKDAALKAGTGMIKKTPGGKEALEDIEKISGEKHSPAVWIIAIMISFVKDLIDFGTIGATFVINWIVDPIIAVTLFFIFGFKKGIARRVVIWVIVVVLKIVPIPGEDFVPWWTLSILLLYLFSDRGTVVAKRRVKTYAKKGG